MRKEEAENQGYRHGIFYIYRSEARGLGYM